MTQASESIPEVTVNGLRIDADQIATEMQYHHAESFDQALHQSMEALVIKTLLIQRAQQLGIIGSAEDINDERTTESAIEKLIEQEVTIPETSDDACQAYFDNNRQRFVSPPLIEARHILLACAPDDINARIDMRQQAEQLITQLSDNLADFESMVKLHSSCPSKNTGGHLGQISPGSTVPEFEKALMRQRQGLCSSPIESRYGFHIVDIAHKVDGEALPFEAVRDKIRTYLHQSVIHKAVTQYIQVLAGNSEITGVDFIGAQSPLVQ